MTSLALASIDNLTIGYIVTNMKHEIVLINYAARSLLAATKQIDTLEDVVKRLPDRLALLDHVKYCSIEHKSCSFREVELGDRTVRVFLSPIFGSDELEGNLLTLEDITDKVEQERARDQFLSFLVHEFRTPLTAIRGNSSLIQDYYKDALKDPELNELVGDISTGSTYLLDMVNQFLDMARLEEGRIAYDLQSFEVVDLLHETVDSLEVLAKQRGLALSFNAPADAKAQVVADRQRVKQVVTNLVGNGLKFTEHGSVTVSINQTSEALEVFVTDTGPGIPTDSRDKLFQKFFQASNNKLSKDSAKSTGLGLYAAKLMVEGMGGHISLASSKSDEGSTFVFTLDLATSSRLKRLEKQLYDAKQGVEHAPAEEHHSIALR
jgi:signal transduction histidine kinase